jgi:hypothetical protein
MRISGHGLSIDLPVGWEARIVALAHSAPYLHAANFALRGDAGQFGAVATAGMGADQAFAALVQYPVDEHVTPGRGLFAEMGWPPRLGVSAFSARQLQVTRSGHLGAQQFFTHRDRPFCLYAVITPVRRRPAQLVGELDAVVRTLRVE